MKEKHRRCEQGEASLAIWRRRGGLSAMVNGLSATVHQRRIKKQRFIADGSSAMFHRWRFNALGIFFLFGFLFFWPKTPMAERFLFCWVGEFFFFGLGLFIVVVSDELFSSLLPTSNSCFVTKWSSATKLFHRYCPLLVRNLCFVTKGPKICFTFSDKFYFRH